jgi:repressor LexA
MTGPNGPCRVAPITAGRADWNHAAQLDVQAINRTPLSRRQEQILAYIGHYIDLCGYPPTLREIADAVALKSKSSADYQLNELAAKGLLERSGTHGQVRSLRLVRPGEVA